MELRPDDFEVGKHITVIRGKILDARPPEFNGLGVQTSCETQAMEDPSYQGVVMRITAIDRPFMVVELIGHMITQPISFDLRKGWQFKQLSQEYVDAMLKKNSGD